MTGVDVYILDGSSALPTMCTRFKYSFILIVAVLTSLVTTEALAGPKQGDVIQTDSLSMLLASRDYTTGKQTTLRNTLNLSGNVGLHYYFVDRVRAGMNVQFTERLWPKPAPGSSRFQRFALMPAIGWSFYDPFYAAVIYSYAPRTQGRAITDMAVLGALGVSLPVSRRVKLTFALEGSYAFYYHRTLGLIALTGISIRL